MTLQQNGSTTGSFWSDYQKFIICEVIPSGIRNVLLPEGGMPNVFNAAKKHRGESWNFHQGARYVETDVWKLVESMCYALMFDPRGDGQTIAGQKNIWSCLEDWVDYIKDLPEKTGPYPGYFYTYYTVNSDQSKKRFWDWDAHELYNSGHYYEMAVAYYMATGSTVLIDASIQNADLLYNLFIEKKTLKVAPGHAEIELALIRLARCLEGIGGEYAAKSKKYIDLSEYFLEVRGDYAGRSPSADWPLSLEYKQDHMPLKDQRAAVGHAVRACYTYTAAADLALYKNIDRYNTALNDIWEDIAYTQTYITGGIGSDRNIEGFGNPFQLDNNGAYNETCASCAFMFFSRSMSRIDHNSRYADEIERSLYNILLASVNMKGDAFFYENHMLSGGADRKTWYGTACCPPNLMRTVLSLDGYICRFSDSVLTIEQYIESELTIASGNDQLELAILTAMPWVGNSNITLKLGTTELKTINLRVPCWADGEFTLRVNNAEVEYSYGSNGYISITRNWTPGDTIDINFPLETKRVYSDPRVVTNAGLVAVQRGPFIYAGEGIDNDYDPRNYILPKEADGFITHWIKNFDSGTSDYYFKDIPALKVKAQANDAGNVVPAELTLIPYYAWCNRGSTPMAVYFKESI